MILTFLPVDDTLQALLEEDTGQDLRSCGISTDIDLTDKEFMDGCTTGSDNYKKAFE